MGPVVQLTQVPEGLVIPGREVRNILVLAVPHIPGREGLDTVDPVDRALMVQEALLTLVLAAHATQALADPVILAREVVILALLCVNKFCLKIIFQKSSSRQHCTAPVDVWRVFLWAIINENAKKGCLPLAREQQMRQRLTKLIATATLLSVCGSAYGQATVWACQTLKAAGMSWENGHWETSSFNFRPNYLLRIDGTNSSYQEDGETYTLVCESSFLSVRATFYENCRGVVNETFLINSENGLATYMSTIGGIISGNQRDGLIVSALQCTKF